MCGIAGFRTKGVPASLLEKMTQALVHRGPDDQGYVGLNVAGTLRSWKNPGEHSLLTTGLGHRRLSILDLSENAAQPMHTEDGRFFISYNGEIYNYVELRKELGGDSFRSTSDTEVLLRLFAKLGPQSLQKLNGIFAFAIWDTKSGNLWLARDPLGIKPLYYFQDERGFFFASEIKALLKVMPCSPSLRVSLLARYLMTNCIADPDTLFDGICKLEPGHTLLIKPDLSVENRGYFDMQFHPEEEIQRERWLAELDSVLRGAIERQLRSDVPVAFFLSGGLDSSLLAASSIAVQKEKPTTFTVGFRWSHSEEDSLDLDSARIMAKHFSFQHHEVLLEPSIVSMLPKVVEILEEPISDPAAICSFLICEAASKHCKVLISGQGGDELFGGYPAYRAGQLAYGVQQLPSPVLSIADFTTRFLPYSIQGVRLQTVHRLKKLLFSTRHEWPEPFLLLRSAMRMEDVAELLIPEIFSLQAAPFDRHLDHFEKAAGWDPLHQLMYLDTKTYLTSNNLAYSDKTSMANSVELRVPFLDLELVKLMERVPHRFKANLNESKILLKLFSEKRLPPEIIHRKKSGFGLPLKDWFLDELQPMAHELLTSSVARRLFDSTIIERWLSQHREKTADHSFKLYNLMTLCLWCEKFGVGES